jgi:uncharacterized protein (TIGR02266 family)
VSSSTAVRVRLRYSDLETFIERFAPNVTRGGIFLASRAPRTVGDVLQFEVQLADGTVALSGEGKVIWVKPYDAAEPQKPHGMGVQFIQVDATSRSTLDRILQVKSTRPAGAGAPAARTTQPHPTLSRSAGAASNGRARVDTSVDLAAEFGIDDATLRRVIDRNWTLGSRGAEDVEALLQPDPSPPASLAEALVELPRLLDPSARHRSGAQRVLESLARGAGDRAAAAHDPTPKNGQSAHDPSEAARHDAERRSH